jgi:hypothetical protein
MPDILDIFVNKISKNIHILTYFNNLYSDHLLVLFTTKDTVLPYKLIKLSLTQDQKDPNFPLTVSNTSNTPFKINQQHVDLVSKHI